MSSFFYQGQVVVRNKGGDTRDLVMVLDKGNDSKQNFKAVAGNISWVGALVPSHHKELMDLDLSSYHGTWKDLQYYRCTKTIMDLPCSVVLTFNSATKRKQEHTPLRNLSQSETRDPHQVVSRTFRPTESRSC